MLQAMGIFGHMTANSPLKQEGGGGTAGDDQGEDLDEDDSPTPSDDRHAPGDSKAFLKDVDKKLSQFDGEVGTALKESSFKGTTISQHGSGSHSHSEPPHFTIQESPTRTTPMSELVKND